MRNVFTFCSITAVLCVCSLLGSAARAYEVENLTKLTDGPIGESGCTFNASGTKIAYRNLHSPYFWANCDIWVMNIDGSGKDQITTDSRGEFGPSFAPDGRITYTKEFGSNDYDLWIVNADGSNPHSLIGGSYRQQNCRWHPNGTKIVYESEYKWGGPTEIWTANPDGSGKVRLTDHTVDGYGQYNPVYSRSGSVIAYANYASSSASPDIWVMNSDGSGKHQITFDASGQNPMFWWPDDSRIGYVQDGDLWLHNLSTSTDELLLSMGGGSIDWCDLSPDGTKLVFDWADASGQHIWIGDVTGGGPPPQLPDFSIEDVNVVQVVFDPDINGDSKIDLVAGKSTAVLVRVKMEGDEVLAGSDLVKVELIFGGNASEEVRKVSVLRVNKTIDFYPYPSDYIYPPGDLTVIAEVDSGKDITESNEGNNQSTPKTITIKETNGLHLVYFPVDGLKRPGILGDYGPLDMNKYSRTVTNSGEFIEATYPIAGARFTNDEQDMKFYGSSMPFIGMLSDLLELWAMAERLSYTSVDRAVGIIPEDYFDYHQVRAFGCAVPGIPAALADMNYWTLAAHEIGHTYGLWQGWPWGDGEEYKQPGVTNAKDASGFWVDNPTDVNTPRERSDGACLMGNCHKLASFDSGKYFPDTEDNMPMWICNEDYVDLFQEFRVNKLDPPAVLLLNGIISKDGTIQLGSLYMVENGIIDNVMPGDYSIQILDADSQILNNIPFFTAFYAHLDPIGIVETDFAGFAFVIAYPENASMIRIQDNGVTLIEINPNSKLLHDAVDSIPDYGFVRNPDQRRKALHNKIDEIEAKIKNNEIQDAMNKLKFDVRDKFEKWLADGYQPQNPLQLSKSDILELVDNILTRFNIIWPDSVLNSEIAESEVVSAETEFEWIIPEESIVDMEDNLQITDDDTFDNGGEDAFDVKEAVGFMLFEASVIIEELGLESFNNEESAIEMTIEMDFIFSMLDAGMYFEALDVLETDILQRTDGCANIGVPDENDWITSIEGQALVYPLVTETIELLESLL